MMFKHFSHWEALRERLSKEEICSKETEEEKMENKTKSKPTTTKKNIQQQQKIPQKINLAPPQKQASKVLR